VCWTLKIVAVKGMNITSHLAWPKAPLLTVVSHMNHHWSSLQAVGWEKVRVEAGQGA
jgi:hypothetical protein